ncbi:ABC transporter substrate-binding protein [Roseomonas xinghualingensis]|uniref:ABC transporter substrate-binding protein n=1 Tax=Roseomonas xinghualingensis TaxID=2986475 RepID=UPI0021F0FA25|nr:ABC transporter substrate-binding protein [Roseomonas sp. SXEYE001]MCV4207830.1 ABC transporter substrate-binding protein [Roseomonas sp. SXEYE001]
MPSLPTPYLSRRLLLGAALAPALPRLSLAQAPRTLDLAVSAPPSSVDPHYYTLTPNNALAAHIFDNLVHRNAQGRLVPALAESWRLVDDTTWEFKLRQGVTFHNGQPFTAADVTYTIDRVPRVLNSPGSFAVFTKAIRSMEVVNPHLIRMRTAGIYPLLPADMSQVAIIWHGLGENPATGDFNNGKNAIGTGPFRLIAFRSGDRVELERNEGYWGNKPAWQRVNYRIITNDGARVAALKAGDVGFIDAVPTSDIARLRTERGIDISETVSLRSVYLRTDLRPETPYVAGPNGEPMTRNPLVDLRVRQALNIAINRPAIADRIMSGAAIPTGQFMPPGTYGHVPDLAPPAFDPDRAKKLLAEAGYPQGFTVTLLASNDRYVNDAQVAQSIGQMWTRIGVKTRVDTMPFSVVSQRVARYDNSISLGGWANSSGEPSSGLRGLLGTRDMEKGWGTVNRTGYSSPQFDAVLERAMATVDDEAREALMQEATRIAARDVGWIPLHVQKNVWAMRQGLTHTPRADEMTLAQDVRPG